ncbi:hypothetical protein HG536_0B03570 [Torulaspora globosa]|uniref:Uncharacterized protein n=1 Tax=Torulaspora globosa TaxID=48254 RepID=A0A7G3ZDA8_9SACH|nr:uncharacterized protein HG536_0B03570 [Torulaspora globosa]QLL31494.1 hypothetical protein HG536_0B03570 [Torulaspora globosa]
MSLKTPTQPNTEKKVHTPPSIGRDPGKPKLLKSLSGKVFKRSSNSDSDTLPSSGLFVPAPSLSSRYPLPKPLNIPQPLSPPPSVKKTCQWSPGSRSSFPHTAQGNRSHDVLESPIQLAPSLKIQALEKPLDSFNLTTAFNSAYRSEQGREVSPHDNTIIWTDTLDDPYLEEDSPTYLTSISQNISKTSAKAGHRTFIGLRCSMCDEKICNTLSGEKITELTCSHASHYQCYLATLECLQPAKRYPECRICGKTVKPSDKSTWEKMVTHLLSRKGSYDCSETVVEPQLLYSKQPTTASQHAFFTPGEQIIRTADISSSGFRTPYGPLRSASDACWNTCTESYDALFQHSIWLEETLLGDDGQADPKGDEGHDASGLGPQIEVLAGRRDSEYGITVRVPKESGRESHQTQECDDFASQREALKQRIEESVKDELDNDTQLGSLVMFDRGDFSTDGERWNKDVTLYLFDQFLILFDRQALTVSGKIPLGQICQVLKLDESTLLIDLKSRTLPQMYMSFPPKGMKNSQLEKWRFYLGHIGSGPSLEDITRTCWDVLPEELVGELNAFFEQANESTADAGLALSKPWETLQTHVPLQLIVCLSLSNDSGMKNEDYQHSIIKLLKCLLNALNDDDLLGLVAVGKDGRGNIGRFGTFFGTVNKHWPYWNEAFSDLEASKHRIFDSADSELDKMLETCLRLVSTAESMLEQDKSAQFSKQVILLRDGTPAKNDHKYGRLITEVHNFNLMQIQSINSLSQDELTSVIDILHRSYLRNLTVTYANEKLLFGNMAPGAEKKLPFKLDHESIPESCEISWIDSRTQEANVVTTQVTNI